MNAVGVIAEYNPFHNGHAYHLKESRSIAGADAVVVAMSGNYVQRGEPAILDKWIRSAHAVNNGADLVVEIPALFSLADAGHYAKAGVTLLESLGCVTHIAFGSECGDTETLNRISSNISAVNNEIHSLISEYSKTGLSYPAARQKAYTDLFTDSCSLSDEIKVLSGSNDILGIEYIIACQSAEPVAVKRVGSSYNSDFDINQEYQSASAIRKLIREMREEKLSVYQIGSKEQNSCTAIRDYVPADVCDDVECRYKLFIKKWFDLIRFSIITTPAELIDNCPAGGEGLGNKLKECIYKAKDTDDLIHLVKSRKYTYSRISRLCAQLVLGIFNNYYENSVPEYIRVLAFNETGRKLLSEIKKNERNRLPVITNIGRESGKLDQSAVALFEHESRANDVYNTLVGNDLYNCSDYRRCPTVKIY